MAPPMSTTRHVRAARRIAVLNRLPIASCLLDRMLAVEVSSVKQGRVRGAFPLTSLSPVFILTRVYKNVSKSRKLDQITHADPSGGHSRRGPEDRGALSCSSARSRTPPGRSTTCRSPSRRTGTRCSSTAPSRPRFPSSAGDAWRDSTSRCTPSIEARFVPARPGAGRSTSWARTISRPTSTTTAPSTSTALARDRDDPGPAHEAALPGGLPRPLPGLRRQPEHDRVRVRGARSRSPMGSRSRPGRPPAAVANPKRSQASRTPDRKRARRMPLPKRRHSKTRGRKRRTHYKMAAPDALALPAVPGGQAPASRLPPLRLLQGARSHLGRGRVVARDGSPRPMKIAVDAMGGDFGPAVVVEGRGDGVPGVRAWPRCWWATRRPSSARSPASVAQDLPLVVRHASQVVGMAEAPSQALRRKRDSSLRVAAELVQGRRVPGARVGGQHRRRHGHRHARDGRAARAWTGPPSPRRCRASPATRCSSTRAPTWTPSPASSSSSRSWGTSTRATSSARTIRGSASSRWARRRARATS